MKDEFLCPFPWLQLSTEPEGSCRVCCYGDSGKTLGLSSKETLKINDSSILKNKMNHPELKQLRKQMINGEVPSFCQGCKRREDVGEASPRKIFLEHYSKELEFAMKTTNRDSGELSCNAISILELTLGNTCNLRCRSCSPYFSSSLEKEFTKLNIKYSKSNVQEIQSFWREGSLINSIINLSQSVREMKFLGGEPLITPVHEKIIDTLIKNDLASEIVLIYNTNLTVVSDELLLKWRQFKAIKLDISIDAQGELNEYLRFPLNWQKFQDNLEKVFSYKETAHVDISFNTVFQAYNVPFIIKLLEFLKPYRDRSPIVPYFIYLDYPYYLKADVLKKETLIMAKELLVSYFAENESVYSSSVFKDKNKQNFSLLLSLFDLSIVENKHNHYFEFLKFTKQLDNIRNQSYFNFLK